MATRPPKFPAPFAFAKILQHFGKIGHLKIPKSWTGAEFWTNFLRGAHLMIFDPKNRQKRSITKGLFSKPGALDPNYFFELDSTSVYNGPFLLSSVSTSQTPCKFFIFRPAIAGRKSENFENFWKFSIFYSSSKGDNFAKFSVWLITAQIWGQFFNEFSLKNYRPCVSCKVNYPLCLKTYSFCFTKTDQAKGIFTLKKWNFLNLLCLLPNFQQWKFGL